MSTKHTPDPVVRRQVLQLVEVLQWFEISHKRAGPRIWDEHVSEELAKARAVLSRLVERLRRLTDKEAARELFVAGYHQALDDVAKRLGMPADAGFLTELRAKAAGVKASAAIKKATGAQQ